MEAAAPSRVFLTTDAKASVSKAVFAAAIFTSAFLLFWLQPLFSKMVLPSLGGSPSVWDSHADLRRFIRWPVHVAIMNNWRGRIRVRSASWDDERFVPEQAWLRAEEHIRAPRDR